MVAQLVTDMLKEDFLYHLARSIHLLRFEARKDSQTILSCVFRFRPPGSTAEDTPAIAHVIDDRPEVIIELCRGYGHKESVMACGPILREILKNEHLTAIVLYDESQSSEEPAIRVDDMDTEQVQTGQGVFWRFFDWIENSIFEASTDAFSTFREILTRHKAMVAQYLLINFDLFFSKYNSMLIMSKSYVTKRQSIKLLGEILLDRANYNIMTAYVDNGEHLKLCMNLLKHERKMVQYEGFHVFKVSKRAIHHRSLPEESAILMWPRFSWPIQTSRTPSGGYSPRTEILYSGSYPFSSRTGQTTISSWTKKVS